VPGRAGVLRRVLTYTTACASVSQVTNLNVVVEGGPRLRPEPAQKFGCFVVERHGCVHCADGFFFGFFLVFFFPGADFSLMQVQVSVSQSVQLPDRSRSP
jgi:hypothetical protein